MHIAGRLVTRDALTWLELKCRCVVSNDHGLFDVICRALVIMQP
jgi:hypothetical protein